MEYLPLSKLFYKDKEQYDKIYMERFHSEYTTHLDFDINGYQTFFVKAPSLYSKTIDIYKTDKRIKELRNALLRTPHIRSHPEITVLSRGMSIGIPIKSAIW